MYVKNSSCMSDQLWHLEERKDVVYMYTLPTCLWPRVIRSGVLRILTLFELHFDKSLIIGYYCIKLWKLLKLARIYFHEKVVFTTLVNSDETQLIELVLRIYFKLLNKWNQFLPICKISMIWLLLDFDMRLDPLYNSISIHVILHPSPIDLQIRLKD